MGSTHGASIRLRCVSWVVAVAWTHGALYAQAQCARRTCIARSYQPLPEYATMPTHSHPSLDG